jgi:cation transport ATPase
MATELGISQHAVVALALTSVAAGGFKVMLKAMANLARLTLDMNVLLIVATDGAIILRTPAGQGHCGEGPGT